MDWHPFRYSVSYPQSEEAVNAAIHGLGFVLSLLGAAALLITWQSGHGPVGLAVACGIYTMTLSVVYAISAMSHVVQRPRPKHRLRAWDQGAIYLLIVGTYTPFAWVFLPPGSGGLFLAVIWTAALLGFCLKVVARYRMHDGFSTISYIALGWLPALPFVGRVPWQCVAWMLVGGISYTAGTWFLKWDRRYAYFHAIWHAFVVGGSVCQYYAIYAFILLPGVARDVPQ